MFDFRIINTEGGNQIIDRTLQTPYDSIDAITMLEYIEVASAMYAIDKMKRKKEIELKRNKWYHKLAMACRLL